MRGVAIVAPVRTAVGNFGGALRDVPAAEREHYAEHMIRRPLPSYLDSVVRGTGYFAETGTPVTKNQFGTHPIYSPTD